MKKLFNNILISFTFVLVGVLIAYQYNNGTLNGLNDININKTNNADILMDIDELEKQKKSLESANEEITKELDSYEATASSPLNPDASKATLEEGRKLLGLTEVTGDGVTITLSPNADIFNTSFIPIDEREISFLINELYSASAEAISINNIRVNFQSVIKMDNTTDLKINNNKVNIMEPIIIKAIGDKTRISEYLQLSHVKNFESLSQYTIKVTESKDLILPPYNEDLNYDHIEKDIK